MISEELKNDLKIKWDRMRDGMAKMGIDACLLTVDVNLYYTTGQIYSGYFYLPVDGEPWFLIKRPNGLSGHQVEYIRKPEDIPPLFAERGIKMPQKLLLEADELTYNEYIRLDKVFQPEEAGNATAFMRNLRRVKTPWEIGQFRIAARKRDPGMFPSRYDRLGVSVRDRETYAQKRLDRSFPCFRSQYGYLYG